MSEWCAGAAGLALRRVWAPACLRACLLARRLPACSPAVSLPTHLYAHLLATKAVPCTWTCQPQGQLPALPVQSDGWTKELPKYLPWLKRTSPYYNLISDESQIWQGGAARCQHGIARQEAHAQWVLTMQQRTCVFHVLASGRTLL